MTASHHEDHATEGQEVAGWQYGGRKKPWRRLWGKIPALFGLLLLVAAVIVMWREVRILSLHDIYVSLGQIPEISLWEGVGAAFLSYFILSFYDGLACRHVGAAISWKRSAFVAFCSYVLSHNLGCAAISGTAVRYRLYRGWGVSGSKIAGIVAFCSLTFLLGAIGLSGFVLLWQPGVVPVLSHLPHLVLQFAGVACYLCLLVYLGIASYKKELKFGKWHLELPGWKMGLVQIIVSMADITATALIAWCVIGPLPPECGLGFAGFLAIYVGSYIAGLIASVPGGLGVFDSAMLVALSPWLPVPHIMSAVLIFRLFYYIIPLVLAGLFFVGHELFLRGIPFFPRILPKFGSSAVIRESEADFSVGVAAGVQALLGVATIIYALLFPLPMLHSRMEALLVQLAIVLLLLCGVGLLGLAVGLSQRVTLAWRLSLFTHCLSLPLLWIVHASWVAYLVAVAVMMMLLTFRNCYYRQSHWRVAPLSPAILAPFSLWIMGVFGVWWIAHQRHLGSLWWRALIYDAHTAKGRWLMGAAILCFIVAVGGAVRRTRISSIPWSPALAARYRELEEKTVEDVPENHMEGNAIYVKGHYILPDAALLSSGKDALVAFREIETFIIALGPPMGEMRHARAAIWRLRDYAGQQDCSLAVLQDSDWFADVYSDMGLSQFQVDGGYLFCEIEDYSGVFPLLYARGIVKSAPFVPLSLSHHLALSSR